MWTWHPSRRNLWWRAVGAVIGTLVLGFSQVRAAELDLSESLVRECGLGASLEATRADILRTLAGERSHMPAAMYARIEEATRKNFDVTGLIATVEASIRSHVSVRDQESVLAWCRSPTGKKLTLLERVGARAKPAFAAYVRSGETVPSERAAQLERITSASAVREALPQLLETFGLQFFRSMNEALPPQKRRSEEALKADVSRLAATASEAVARELPRLMQFVYRGASDGELASYVDLLESKAGRSMTGAKVKGLLSALGAEPLRLPVDRSVPMRSRTVDDYYEDVSPTTRASEQPPEYFGSRRTSR